MCAIIVLTTCTMKMQAMQDALQNKVQTANPVRKVVTMLQAMQTKVTAEGEKEKELHDKFVCYCNTYSNVELRKECAADRAKIEELTSAIAASKAELAQLGEELKTHAQEEVEAKKAMSEATAIREKEASSFATLSADDQKNIAAIKKAIAAIKKGIEGKFLQTDDAQDLQRFFITRQDVSDEDRNDVMAFLSGKESAPSDVIIGVLQNMLALMSKTAGDAHDAEQAAIAEYEKLMAAKSKELKAVAAALETKTAREGELSVKLVDTENDLSDTKTSLAQNEKLLTDLDRTCDAKEAEYELNKKMRSEELAALADTIKILNEDDALELFKKTLPKSAGSFLQVKVNSDMLKLRALDIVRKAKTNSSHKLKLDFLTLALKGKKIGFEGILKMIGEMIATLQKEQVDDEAKKAYCASEFDSSDDKKKSEEGAIQDIETTIDDNKESISQVTDEMKALEETIKDTDKAVAEATEQRKDDHAEFNELMASDQAAKEVLGFAKNRLNKFYNPALYVPPPKAELSAEDHIVAGIGGAAFLQTSSSKDAPPPPPAAVSAYKKQSNTSTGVIEMIDLLVSDLDKEMAQHETEEKQDQADYETVMAQSAEKRKADSASLDDKGSMKADLEGQLQKHKSAHKSTKKGLAATLQYIHSLHQECDWLVKYFSVRKEARASEIEALTQAKAILNGADFSLVQTRARRSLRTVR